MSSHWQAREDLVLRGIRKRLGQIEDQAKERLSFSFHSGLFDCYLLEGGLSVVKIQSSKEMLIPVWLGNSGPSFRDGVPRGVKLPVECWVWQENGSNMAHLQGVHFRLDSKAVIWTETDQVRCGDVKRSKVLLSSLIRPLPAAASSESC